MDDPRLKKVIANLQKHCIGKELKFYEINLNIDEFQEVTSGSIDLLAKIFRNDLIIPEFSTFCDSIKMLYQKLKDNFDGEVFDRNNKNGIATMGDHQSCY